MDIIISYSEQQLKSAVKYIAANNPSFKGQGKVIKETILEQMERLATDSNLHSISTMGFLLTCDCEYEGIENDDNVCRIEIHVDPSLGKIDYDKETYIEKMVSSG